MSLVATIGAFVFSENMLTLTLTCGQLLTLYKEFETLYRAYTWVAYTYGGVKWFVGKKKPEIKDDFMLVDD